MAFPHQVPHGWMYHKTFKLKKDTEFTTYTSSKEGWIGKHHTVPARTLVKVVMVSRFGDCGITTNLKADTGYDARVEPDELETGMTRLRFHMVNQWRYFKWFLGQVRHCLKDYKEMVSLDLKCFRR